jgi:hypothetical protein
VDQGEGPEFKPQYQKKKKKKEKLPQRVAVRDNRHYLKDIISNSFRESGTRSG